MTAVERQHADELMRVQRTKLALEDEEIVGFNVGANCGEAAGQTVMHAHLHLIPRRRGDVGEPRGGVIPGKQQY